MTYESVPLLTAARLAEMIERDEAIFQGGIRNSAGFLAGSATATITEFDRHMLIAEVLRHRPDLAREAPEPVADDPRRCPECDFELWYVHARHIRAQARIPPNEVALNVTDAIVCTRCGWFRLATANDLPITDAWKVA